MEMFVSETFRERKMPLDGRAYFKCRFERCELLYGGGDFELRECEIVDCQLLLFGPAERTASMLPTFGWTYPPGAERRE